MDTKEIYDAKCAYKDTENNSWWAVNTVLNRVVSGAYKITSTMAMIGQRRKCPTNNDNDPHATHDSLSV